MEGPPIKIVEVGARDGLQNERTVVPTDLKVAFVNALSNTGVPEVEVTGFVSPKWVPQLGDAEEVLRNIDRRPGVMYSALVPNAKGLDRALSVGLDRMSVFTAASETFNRKNINASIDESLRRFAPVLKGAQRAGVPVRGYVSTAFHCPYEGRITPQAVADVSFRLIDMGISEISLGDTIGKASPEDVRRVLDLLMLRLSARQIALHFHDTYGMAVANTLYAWREYGIYIFDSSAGGLGGCPYAPAATGNVATEDLVFALQASGAVIDVDVEAIVSASRVVIDYLGVRLASHIGRVSQNRIGGGIVGREEEVCLTVS